MISTIRDEIARTGERRRQAECSRPKGGERERDETGSRWDEETGVREQPHFDFDDYALMKEGRIKGESFCPL